MGKEAAASQEARALNSPEDYYQAKQRQQAKYNATLQGDGGMAAKSAPKGRGSYSSVMQNLALGQTAAEQKYGYTLDSFGRRTTAPAPVAARAPAPVAAPAPAPVVAPTDNAVFNNTFATPIAPTLSAPEVKVAETKAAEITSQQTQQTALDDEAKRRADAAKRRGRGISSFLTTGFQGVQQSALAKLLGA